MQPLALRMRPTTIDEIVGQKEILSPNGLLYNMIARDMLQSIILYGPPGTGKTTIADVIAKSTNAMFHQINAVSGAKKDIQAVCEAAVKDQMENPDNKHILFIDEIHRFNKAQQDYLLPFVENGNVILIGATTENPYFEVNPALVSRSTIFQLKPVGKEDIKILIKRALSDIEKGLGSKNQTITEETSNFLSEQSNGDCRFALQKLELASLQAEIEGRNEITQKDIANIIQKPHLKYDKDGDEHYDTISAFIKSMRGSDPDAGLYYLARMLESGEDPKFIARRIMISASEDIGNADPMALVLATSAALCVERIGLPEGQIPLAQAVVYNCMAPKSNSSYEGVNKATEYIKNHPSNDIPDNLRDAHYKSASKLGHGVNYLYPHDYPNHWVPQQYLPDNVTEYFYENKHIGYENVQADYQNNIRKDKNHDNR